ncbi:hypothetical protein MASR2M47_11770 [Draconibacterium sp.]|jgi:hypothetical protein
MPFLGFFEERRELEEVIIEPHRHIGNIDLFNFYVVLMCLCGYQKIANKIFVAFG